MSLNAGGGTAPLCRHCQYCGTPLDPPDGFYSPSSPAWQNELQDTPKQYILVDELGETETKSEYRDTLADEMVNLHPPENGKARRARRSFAPRPPSAAWPRRRARCAPPATAARSFPSCRTIPKRRCGPSTPAWWRTALPLRPTPKLVRTAQYRKVIAKAGDKQAAGDADTYEEREMYDSFDDVEDYVPEYQRSDEYEHRKNPTHPIPQRVLKKKAAITANAYIRHSSQPAWGWLAGLDGR